MLINDFYANREVFITGATGFLGKGLVEKLLRDSPKIKALYLLLRGKKSLSPEQRLEQYKKDKVFERIHEQCPEVLNKLHVIQGDSTELGLGIAPNDLSRLQNVSIVFHMAATVRFDETYRTSVLLNTRGTHELVKIAENFKNLVSFMYCSTAYSNALENPVEERVYEMPVEWRKAIKIAETYDEETLNWLFNKYTGYYPNSYCFSKNLSEQLIKEYSTHMPMSILRPSVVLPANKEPAPGWVDNLHGPVASLVGMSVGVLPISICKRRANLDVVPVDIVTKLTIVAAYKRGMQHLRKEPVPGGLLVVNCCAGDGFNVNFNGSWGLFEQAVRENPLENIIWHYDYPTLTNYYYYFLLHIFLMGIPMAIALDAISVLTKRKPMMVKTTRRIVYTTKCIQFFSCRDYHILNQNMVDLEDSVPQSELTTYGSKEFYALDFNEFFKNFVIGCKYYIFERPAQAPPAARRRAKILCMLNRTIKSLTVTLVILFLWSIVSKF